MNNDVEHNELFSLAEKWVNETGNNIFLTGKAGTGKTTFLKHIKTATHKNTVVLAPTGIAAINAEGSTLHSFFRLPFGTFIPSYEAVEKEGKIITQQTLPSLIRYTRQHIQLLRSIELIIIDEVSMVRTDVLDMIDIILKRFRLTPHLPFGGVQMLFIGDMHQLPPVVKEQETTILSRYYNSPYFFDSKVLANNPPVIIQLEKVYRQQETDFLSLLNELRHNELSENSYEKLISKIVTSPPDDDRYITLTSHVAQADRMNAHAMQKLPVPSHTFQAKIEGDFPESTYPNVTTLELKRGARVMFIKNDPDRKFFNGKTGKVVSINKDEIEVRCDDGNIVSVAQVAWHNVKYEPQSESGKVAEVILGKFWQLPLRLAWAVTIHKSQGLTFDKVIIDAERSFASGQVYVALSRCRTWDGIVLLSQIKPSSLLTDLNVVNFSNKTWKQDHLSHTLPQQRRHFQLQKTEELFDLNNWKRHGEQLLKLILEHENSFSQQSLDYFKKLASELLRLHAVSENFLKQVYSLDKATLLPEENSALIQRIKDASHYFSDQTQSAISTPLTTLPQPPDNAAVALKTLQLLENIREAVSLNTIIWLSTKEKFSTQDYLKVKAKALQELSGNKPLKWTKPLAETKTGNGLESELRAWRASKATMLQLPVYRIISNKVIDSIVADPPLHKNLLTKISGIGSKKAQEYGDEILDIISRYHQLSEEDLYTEETIKKRKTVSGATLEDTWMLYKTGMNAAAIAKARNLSISTINGHFTKLIEEQKISINGLISTERQNIIRDCILHAKKEAEKLSLNAIKEQLDNVMDYHEIKWVMEDMKLNKEL